MIFKLDIKQIVQEIVYGKRLTPLFFVSFLFFINIAWFYHLGFHTLMGDDLLRWSEISRLNFSDTLTYILDGTKYRPINDMVHFILFKLFSYNYQLFFYFNILFNFIVITALFFLVRSITDNNSLVAFCASLAYLTCRFSYFSILQINGLMESLSLLLLILIVYYVTIFIKTGEYKYVISISSLNFLIIFTHERYIVLTPFLLLVTFLFRRSTKPIIKKGALFLVSFPLLLNLFMKKVIFKIPFFQRALNAKLDTDLFSILKNIQSGLLKVLGLNNGPEFLNIISFSNADANIRITSILLLTLTLLVFGISLFRLFKLSSSEQKKELKIFFSWLVLIFSLLLSASVGFIQEQRWLYSSYVVFLIYFSYLISRLSSKKLAALKYFLLALFCFLTIKNDIYYKSFLTNLYFVRANNISDSLYDETIKNYGNSITGYRIYIEKFRDFEWILQDSLFLKPYIADDKALKVTYVNNIKDIDLKNKKDESILIYRLDWAKQKFMNITDEVLNPDSSLSLLVLKKFGPEEVKAGQIFNRQPNGESAIWAETEHATPTTVFILNGVPLESSIYSDSKAASAIIPKQLYEKPGKYTLYLFDKTTNKKSNKMIFLVKP
jgi:hypothetical protein